MILNSRTVFKTSNNQHICCWMKYRHYYAPKIMKRVWKIFLHFHLINRFPHGIINLVTVKTGFLQFWWTENIPWIYSWKHYNCLGLWNFYFHKIIAKFITFIFDYLLHVHTIFFFGICSCFSNPIAFSRLFGKFLFQKPFKSEKEKVFI